MFGMVAVLDTARKATPSTPILRAMAELYELETGDLYFEVGVRQQVGSFECGYFSCAYMSMIMDGTFPSP